MLTPRYININTGIPLLIVAVTLGVTQGEGYGTDSSCWLSVKNNVIWAFVGPAFLVILVGALISLFNHVVCACVCHPCNEISFRRRCHL